MRPGNLALVAAGGSGGTAARIALTTAYPPGVGVPWVVMGLNVAGAFVLGLLLESLARRGVESSQGARLRLLVGTGFLGGFTTYSTLALDVVRLVGGDAGLSGVAYGVGSLALGVLAAALGVALGARGPRRAGAPS